MRISLISFLLIGSLGLCFGQNNDEVIFNSSILTTNSNQSILSLNGEVGKVDFDPYIYQNETITIEITGNINYNPCDVTSSTSGFLGFGKKTYTRRYNDYRSSCVLGSQKKMQISHNDIPYSGSCDNEVYRITFKNTSSRISPIYAYIDLSENKCGGIKLPSSGSLDVKIIVNSADRVTMLENEIQKESNLNLNWIKQNINSRLISLYQSRISNSLLASINKSKLISKDKIELLEYIVTFIDPNNISFKLALGENYKDTGQYKDCIEELTSFIKAFNNSSSEYKFKTIYYIQKMANANNLLANCLVEKEMYMDEDELFDAAFYYGEASRFYLMASDPQNSFKAKLNQINILKRINSIESLNSALVLINESENTFKNIDFSNVKAEYKTKIISGTEKINKFYITDVHNRIIEWTFDEIIFEDNAIIEFDYFPESKYHLKINSPNIFIGKNVTIKRDIPAANNYSAAAKQGVEGLPGRNGDSNLTTIEFNGEIKYIKNMAITLNGGDGGNGQKGGEGFLRNNPGKKGGQFGVGGNPGSVILNLNSADSIEKIKLSLNKGNNGKVGENGEKGTEVIDRPDGRSRRDDRN